MDGCFYTGEQVVNACVQMINARLQTAYIVGVFHPMVFLPVVVALIINNAFAQSNTSHHSLVR
jgi:hypothetical protein